MEKTARAIDYATLLFNREKSEAIKQLQELVSLSHELLNMGHLMFEPCFRRLTLYPWGRALWTDFGTEFPDKTWGLPRRRLMWHKLRRPREADLSPLPKLGGSPCAESPSLHPCHTWIRLVLLIVSYRFRLRLALTVLMWATSVFLPGRVWHASKVMADPGSWLC